TAQADWNFSSGAIRYFADVSFPYLRADRTKVMIAQKSWILTKAVRSVRLEARPLGDAANTWRLYLEGTEEEFESYTPQSFSGVSVNSAVPAYIFMCESFNVVLKSGTSLPMEKEYLMSGPVSTQQTVLGVKVVISDANGANSSIQEDTISVPASGFQGQQIVPKSGVRHTNKSDIKTISITVRVIKIGSSVRTSEVSAGRDSISTVTKYYRKMVSASVADSPLSYFSITSGLAKYSTSINVNVIAAGDISYHATEESAELYV
ncbi:MAG: hypothetical protein ACRC6E_11150, partial [Fusobacteriaceae bacterium]